MIQNSVWKINNRNPKGNTNRITYCTLSEWYCYHPINEIEFANLQISQSTKYIRFLNSLISGFKTS